MKRSRCEVVPVLCLTALVCAGTVDAAEFYSWIDPSGTMVMTDDPTSIPASVSRSPVSIHRFQDLNDHTTPPRKAERQTSPLVRQSPREVVADVPIVKAGRQTNASEELAESSDTSDVREAVLLEAPDGATHREYVWVPLLAPMVFGGTQVVGFWCHRSMSSPVEAFQLFLAQHGAGPSRQMLIAGGQLQLGNLFNRPRSSRFSRTLPGGNGPGGPSVYGQVLQEQRALIDRAMAPFRSGGGPPPTSRNGGSRSAGGQRSHGR